MKDVPAWQRWGDGELAYSPRRGRHAVKVGLASTLAGTVGAAVFVNVGITIPDGKN